MTLSISKGYRTSNIRVGRFTSEAKKLLALLRRKLCSYSSYHFLKIKKYLNLATLPIYDIPPVKFCQQQTKLININLLLIDKLFTDILK